MCKSIGIQNQMKRWLKHRTWLVDENGEKIFYVGSERIRLTPNEGQIAGYVENIRDDMKGLNVSM